MATDPPPLKQVSRPENNADNVGVHTDGYEHVWFEFRYFGSCAFDDIVYIIVRVGEMWWFGHGRVRSAGEISES
jgi:hypothetical protein